MAKYALYVELAAKPGKEAELESFLMDGAEMSRNEKGTLAWFGFKEDNGRYGIFDTFEDEGAREDHLSGEIAKALTAKAGELLSVPPIIHRIAVIAERL